MEELSKYSSGTSQPGESDSREGRIVTGRLTHKVRNLIGAAVLSVASGATGFEFASASSTTLPSQTQQVESVAMAAVEVDQSVATPPVDTPSGLSIAEFSGAVQGSVSTSSTPWVLCPGGGVTLSPAAVADMQTFNVAQINKYFTGAQQQYEMSKLSNFLNGSSSGTVATAHPWPCNQMASNWDVRGPDVTSLIQWSSVTIGVTTATINAEFKLDELACQVNQSADSQGQHSVDNCGAPSGPVAAIISLQTDSSGNWLVDSITWMSASSNGASG